MKRILALTAAAVLALALCSCSGSGKKSGTDTPPALGDTVKTIFFDFSVESAQWVDEINGYTPAEGNGLLDTVIKIKNTSGDELPMGIYDFQAQWGGAGDEDFAFQDESITGDGIMPVEFYMAKNETVEYHVYFDIPAGSTDLSVSYWELYTDKNGEEQEGDTYFVYFTA